jgi:hypothetical protein
MPIRPKSVSPPIKIYEIKLDRAAIDQMPPDARRNLFRFGHVANDINTLSRLLIISIKKYEDRIVAMFGDARAASILRFLIGSTREGYLAVDRFILSSLFGREYLPRLTSEGEEALNRVKAHLGKMQLITGLRNEFSFHVPDNAEIDRAYGKLPIDVDVAVYSGAERHSSLYQMSHNLLICGMLELVPDSHAMTDNDAMDAIISDLLSKSIALNDFIEQLIIVLVERHNLSPEPMREVASIDTVESVSTFAIPPLMRT